MTTFRLRRKLTLAVATLGVVGALSSCGFDYATNRPNELVNAGFDITGPVKVTGVRIVSPSSGTGTLIATLATDDQTDTDEPIELESVTGDDITAGDFTPIEIGPHDLVNLATAGGIPVTGDFHAGSAFPVTLGFSNGEEVDVTAVVVTQCHEYADVTPQASETAKPGKGGATEASEEPTESETAAPYDCAFPSAPAIGEAEGH